MVIILPLSETNWTSNRSFLPVHHNAVQRLLPRLAVSSLFNTNNSLDCVGLDALENFDDFDNIDV